MTTLRDLRNNDVDIVTIGQYLQPSDRQLKVERYVTPEEFQAIQSGGRPIGLSPRRVRPTGAQLLSRLEPCRLNEQAEL